jgi:glucoamylase
MPGALPLAIVSPAAGATVGTASVTVTGTTTPGAQITAESEGAAGGQASTAATIADADGNWSLSVPASFGPSTITVAAMLGRSTGYAQTTVTDTAVPGTTVFSVTDPTGDDDGPGTYQYPTDSSFQPGAFDLTEFSVNQTSDDVYLTVGIRNLAPTFGSAFGAQLLDIYVDDPTASTTSTQPADPGRNYTIVPADAWSELVEAQAFAPVLWTNTSGTSLGSAQLVVDAANNTATIELPISEFGSVGSDWAFTVTLTGQDGYQSDLARAFTATPGAYTFGVCTPGGTSPICSVDPGTVPQVIDTITPTGVSQATELDPTLGPVVLQGVTVP